MGITQTEKYLSPILNTYTKKFKEEFFKLEILEYRIGDKKRPNIDYCLFIRVKGNVKNLINSKYYVDHYKYDKDTIILIVKIIKKFHKAFNYFFKSEYSNMYEVKEIREMFEQFIGGDINPIYYVLTRDYRYEKKFIKLLKNTFNIDNFEPNVQDREWDFPILLEKEFYG